MNKKKEIKWGIPGKKMKGISGDRCLRVLVENKHKIVVLFLEVQLDESGYKAIPYLC